MNPASVGLVVVTSSEGKSLPYGKLEDVLSRDAAALNCHTNDDKYVTTKREVKSFRCSAREGAVFFLSFYICSVLCGSSKSMMYKFQLIHPVFILFWIFC